MAVVFLLVLADREVDGLAAVFDGGFDVPVDGFFFVVAVAVFVGFAAAAFPEPPFRKSANVFFFAITHAPLP